MAIESIHHQPVIAQLAEHLTVDFCSDQMVPGSIPGDRILIISFRHMTDDFIPLPAHHGARRLQGPLCIQAHSADV